MSDITGEIHVKLFELLDAHSGLEALVGERIFDIGAVPTEPVFPYIEFGRFYSTDAGDKGDDDTDSGDAVDWAQMIEVWDRSPNVGAGRRGKKRAELIVKQIAAALHGQSADLGGSPPVGRLILSRVKTVQMEPDPDGLSIHGTVRIEGYATAP